MGFLSAYSGTKRIELDNTNSDGERYWIDVKKCLAREETEVAEKLLTSATTHRDKTGERNTNTAGYRTYLVAASIVDWNLDEDDGTLWQLAPDSAKRRNVARLPEAVFQQVFEEVDQLNGRPTAKQRADFRDPGDDGDPVGEVDGRPGEPEDVRPGEGDLDAPGPALG